MAILEILITIIFIQLLQEYFRIKTVLIKVYSFQAQDFKQGVIPL